MNGLPPWGEVLATALVGTDRRPLAGASTHDDPAVALLDTAGLLTLARRAGVAPVTGLTPPAAAADDDGTPASAAAAARLAGLLFVDTSSTGSPLRGVEGRVEVLVEWLGAAAAAGRRVPSELLPDLLDLGRRHRPLRPYIAAAGGARAAWLGGQRPEWRYVGPPKSDVDDRDVWALGPLEARVDLLASTRVRDPDAGRALLESGWAGESPDDRAPLLKALAKGLSTADEPLLERALDDRRREVRTVAVALLVRLSDSAFSRRMADRVTACVRLTGPTVEIEPPSVCDGAMRRDGITPKPPSGMGERAWWLEELIGNAPLSVWGDPATFLARSLPDGWAAVVRRGLARAAANRRDLGWAAALVGPLTDGIVDGQGGRGPAPVGIEYLLRLFPRPWPEALADAVGVAMERLAGPGGLGWRLVGLCELAALGLPPGTVDRAAALAASIRAQRANDPAAAAVDRMADILRFRHDMLEELR